MRVPPLLAPEDRAAALAKAARVRKARSEVKTSLKHGTLTLSAVLEDAREDEVIAKLRVTALLEAMPGVEASPEWMGRNCTEPRCTLVAGR